MILQVLSLNIKNTPVNKSTAMSVFKQLLLPISRSPTSCLYRYYTSTCKDGAGSKAPDDGGSSKGVNPSTPSLYDCRKYGHYLPGNNWRLRFDPLPGIPTGIFRCTDGEILGPKADKCSYYPCPEYFSYHHMSFYDLHLILCGCRLPRQVTGRKP